MEKEKKEWTRPSLTEYGTIAEITENRGRHLGWFKHHGHDGDERIYEPSGS